MATLSMKYSMEQIQYSIFLECSIILTSGMATNSFLKLDQVQKLVKENKSRGYNLEKPVIDFGFQAHHQNFNIQ